MTIPVEIIVVFLVAFLSGLAWLGRRVEKVYTIVALHNQRIKTLERKKPSDTDFERKENSL